MTDVQTAPTHTLQQLARTTAISLVVAAVLLVTIVLPAEYAIDPLGTGRWLGLTDIASPPVTAAGDLQPTGAGLVPVAMGPAALYPAEFKLDTFEVTLQPYEYVEYKYRLAQGATMLYAWQATAPRGTEVKREKADAKVDDLKVGQHVIVDAMGDSISELTVDKVTIVPAPK